MISRIKILLNMYKTTFHKRDKSLWIFGAWLGSKFADNSKYLFLKALKQGINATWITKKENIYEELKSKNIPVEMHNSKRGIELQKNAGYAICCVGPYDFDEQYLGGATVVNLDHGITLKKGGYDDKITNTQPVCLRLFKDKVLRGICFHKSYRVATSERMVQIYSHMLRTRRKHIINSGYPRNDMFFENHYQEEFDFSIFNEMKIITYLPTHRKEGRERMEIGKVLNLKIINEICKDNNYCFVIKKHFYHKSETEDLEEYSNIMDLTGTDIDTQELLRKTDILITDYSSVYIDFLLLDKPIILYQYDYRDYTTNDRELYFKNEEIIPGPTVTDVNNLVELLSQYCSGEYDNYKKERENCRLLFFDRKRKACSNELLDAIRKL